MASPALFEPAVRHRHLAIDAGIDAVRAAQPAVAAAEARKGRTVDGKRPVAVVGGQYAFLASPEQAVDDLTVAAFQADARPVDVRNPHVLEHQPVNAGAIARQPPPRPALAGPAVAARPPG